MEHDPKKVYPKSYDEASNSDYLASDDLDGKAITVTLVDMEKALLEGEDGKAKKRFIYTLKEHQKRWVSNTTNNMCLEAMFGADPAAALGHRVTLKAEPCKVGGKSTQGIRVQGSPDLAADKTISIKVTSRRRAEERTLRRTGGAPATNPPPAPSQIGPAQKWLNACAAMGYDADTAKSWARDLRGCEWETPWTPEHVQVCGAAIEQAKATAAAVAAGTQREPGVD